MWNKALRCMLVVMLVSMVGVVAAQEVKKDVPYVPTPQTVVDGMLQMAQVTDKDIVYDLGCGDGRIVVTAAKEYGARGKGYDIDPQRITESKQNAQQAGVTDKVEFFVQDLFETDMSEATVVALYLLPSVNERLRPQLFEQLKPGTRVVSHAFGMGDWEPDETRQIDGRTVHFWVIPAELPGVVEVKLPNDKGTAKMQIEQKYQKVTGSAEINGQKHAIQDGRIEGEKFMFSLAGADGASERYSAKIGGEKPGTTLQAEVAREQSAQPAGAQQR